MSAIPPNVHVTGYGITSIERTAADPYVTNYTGTLTIFFDYTTGENNVVDASYNNFNGFNVNVPSPSSDFLSISAINTFATDSNHTNFHNYNTITLAQFAATTSSDISGASLSYLFTYGDTTTPTATLSLPDILNRWFPSGTTTYTLIFSLIEVNNESNDINIQQSSMTSDGLNKISDLIQALTGVPPPIITISAPVAPKAFLGPANAAANIFLEWTDDNNTALINEVQNIYYQIQYTDNNSHLSFTDVAFDMVSDTDINSDGTALIRKKRANLYLPNATYTAFQVRAGLFNVGDAYINDALSFSAFTPFVLHDISGNVTTSGMNYQGITVGTDVSYAIIDNTRSIFLPPGTYEVGNGGTDAFGNNPFWGTSSASGQLPYQHRWTIKDTVTGKLYAARHSSYISTDGAIVPPMDVSASFSLTNGTYIFNGFPLITFPDDAGNVLIDSYNSWPVVVLQDFSHNIVTVTGIDVTKNTNTTNPTYNKNQLFKNNITQNITYPIPGINNSLSLADSYFSYYDASINNTDESRYSGPYDASSSSILVTGLGAVVPTASSFPTNNMSMFSSSEFGAASVCEDINNGVSGNGWLSLLPKTATYYPDISNAAVSRPQLIRDISNGLVFPGQNNNNQLGLYTKSVTITVNEDFTNNKIHLWDGVWGWQTQGHNMFTYQQPVDASAILVNDISATYFELSGNTIDMTAALNQAFGGAANLSLLGAGTSSHISANQQTIFNSLTTIPTLNLSNPNIQAVVTVNQFPLNSAASEFVNSAGSTIKTIRLINAGSAYAAASHQPLINTLPLIAVTNDPTQLVYINMDSIGDFFTYTTNNGNLTITLKTNKAAMATAGTLNQYTVTGNATIVNPVGISPDLPGCNAVDGAKVTFLNIPIFLGSNDIGAGDADIPPVCFQRGTRILTPTGYKLVENLGAGDYITSAKNVQGIPVNSMVKFIGKRADGPLYCLPKDSLKKNKPLNDLYMSGDHAFKHNSVWKHMNCASGEKHGTKPYTYQTEQDDIEYYHIIIDDYFAHTIVAEGVEVETCFEDKDDGVLMMWTCSAKCCLPLKCEKALPVKNKERDVNSQHRFSLKSVMDHKNDTTHVSKTKVINQTKLPTKKSMMVWKYDRNLERNVAIQCNEINLPN